MVEAAISAGTAQQLKARSYDPELAQRLTFATTAAGQAKAAKLVRDRNPVRHGIAEDGAIVRLVRNRKRSNRPRSR